ncbi:O-antigen ligase family protein [Dyadobacter sp. CY356]|nr:O-antigen ligase family protein [Dyadobacter sp. CY356]
MLIIIQSCGIRFFDGQGSFLAIIILALLIPKTFYKLKGKDFLILLSIFSFLLIGKFFNSQIQVSMLTYQLLLIFESYLFLKLYKKGNEMMDDLYKCLSIIFIHAAAGFILYTLAPNLFYPAGLGMPYKTLAFIFFVTQQTGFSARSTGILWEPGLLQLMLNLLLFYAIKNRKSRLLMISIVALILTTFSTAGFIILALNFTFFFIETVKEKNATRILFLLMLITLMASTVVVVQNNIEDKFNGQNTSGLIRYRDFVIGVKLIKENPILGHGLFDSSYLTSKSYVNFIETQILSTTYLDQSGFMTGGFTNGLLGVFAWYGIPMGLLIFYLFYKNNFVNNNTLERIIFFLILCLTFISEPITYTAFFLLFPLSSLLLNNEKQLHSKLKQRNFNESFTI